MNEQQKIVRILRLISLLADKPSRNVPELAKVLEISRNTVYRDLTSLKEVGYHIETDELNHYFISESNSKSRNSFEPQELILLNQVLAAIEEANPLRESIKKKLYFSSNLVPLAEELTDIHHAKTVQRLSVAIETQKQCRLLGYQSAVSEMTKDRLIEPISFSKNNSQLCAFDVEKNALRLFKIKRIEKVELLDTPFHKQHAEHQIDVFGFAWQDGKSFLAKLQLSKRAHQLLAEEYPEARKYIAKTNQAQFPYRLVYEAHNVAGIGRFILGLPGEIKVESPNELKEYLKKMTKIYPFS